MILSRHQRIGAAVLFGIAFIGWVAVAVWPSRQPDLSHLSEPPAPKKYRTWEERRDSMERADSIRYAQWAVEREQRYDSVREANARRSEEWKAERQQWYDSVRRADSLWHDSIGIHYVRHIKKDTILDLNHCDTTELQLIRGIGAYTATQIVRYREQLGGYVSPQQLKDPYFAKCQLDTLLAHFTADSSEVQRLHVNTCSLDVLQRHPYLRYNQAKAIYTLRRRYVRLHSINDLRTLPELTEDDLQHLAPYLSFE